MRVVWLPERHLDHKRGLDELDAVVARVALGEEGVELRPGLVRLGALYCVPPIKAGGAVLGLMLASGAEDALRRRAVHRGRDLRRPRGAGPGGELEAKLRADLAVVGEAPEVFHVERVAEPPPPRGGDDRQQ